MTVIFIKMTVHSTGITCQTRSMIYSLPACEVTLWSSPVVLQSVTIFLGLLCAYAHSAYTQMNIYLLSNFVCCPKTSVNFQVRYFLESTWCNICCRQTFCCFNTSVGRLFALPPKIYKSWSTDLAMFAYNKQYDHTIQYLTYGCMTDLHIYFCTRFRLHAGLKAWLFLLLICAYGSSPLILYKSTYNSCLGK